MKTRNGFVSNSSTTSYLIICKETDYNKMLKKVHPYYKAWISQKLNPEKQEFDGKTLVVISTTICSEDMEPIDWDGDDYPPEAEPAEDYGYEEYDECDDNGEEPKHKKAKKEKKIVLDNNVIDHLESELKKITKDVIVTSWGR